MKEEKLIQRLKKGDPKALEAVIGKYSGYVLTVVRNFSRGTLPAEDVDDVCSEVFFKFWQCRENLNEKTEVRAYLSAAARNAVKDRYKSSPPPHSDISELEIPSDFSVEKTAELNEMMKCLSDRLKSFTKEERDIFLRSYFYGESSVQIADLLGIPDATVRTKLHRTKAKLKEYLEERGFHYV